MYEQALSLLGARRFGELSIPTRALCALYAVEQMMFQTVRPPGLSPFSSRVFDVLEAHTTFPWAALKTQCGWRGIDPVNLTPDALTPIIPHLAAAIGKVTDRENASKLMAGLWTIVDEARSEAATATVRLG